MTDEPRYTLAEARRELEKLECARMGHDYNIMLHVESNTPVSINCSRCGRSWNVTDDRR